MYIYSGVDEYSHLLTGSKKELMQSVNLYRSANISHWSRCCWPLRCYMQYIHGLVHLADAGPAQWLMMHPWKPSNISQIIWCHGELCDFDDIQWFEISRATSMCPFSYACPFYRKFPAKTCNGMKFRALNGAYSFQVNQDVAGLGLAHSSHVNLGSPDPLNSRCQHGIQWINPSMHLALVHSGPPATHHGKLMDPPLLSLDFSTTAILMVKTVWVDVKQAHTVRLRSQDSFQRTRTNIRQK